MSYNQHNAGMHLIWHKRYALYEDLHYYDKLAEKANKSATITQEKNEICVNKRKDSDKQVNLNKLENVGECKMENTNEIGIQYFCGLPDTVMANIMLIAIKNKKDIRAILEECENMLSQDKRINQNLSDGVVVPKVEAALIFLQMVADKMECSVYEFFIEDEKYRQRCVYNLIRDIKALEYSFSEFNMDIQEDGSAFFSISRYDFLSEMTNEFSKPTTEDMSLDFVKEVYEDGTVNYVVSFGTMMVSKNTRDNYCVKGAYLLEEEKGILADYIEELISTYR